MKKTSVLIADRHTSMLESIRDLLETIFDTVVIVSDEESLKETVDRFDPDICKLCFLPPSRSCAFRPGDGSKVVC